MNKEYQFVYNETHFREKMWLLYDLSQQRNKSRARSYITFLVLCAILGSSFLYFDAGGSGLVVGLLLVLTGTVYLIVFFNYLFKSKRYKAIFNKSMEEIIDRLNATDGLITFTFTDDDFYYSDADFETKIKWSLMKSYLLFDTHLFLVTENSTVGGYTLSAFDLTNSEFNEICEFVKTKLPPHYLTPQQSEKEVSNSEILDN